MEGELESVTSSAGCFVQAWRNETGRLPKAVYEEIVVAPEF